MAIKVYGPYKRPDGRQHVIHYDDVSQTRRTQSYPRYLMEQFLGRALESWEHVDHINDDPTDDRIDNFQLLTQAENNKKAAKGVEYYNFDCPVCGTASEIPYRQYKHNQIVNGRSGPYCSRSCSGKVHH